MFLCNSPAKALPKEYVDKLNRETETDYTVFTNHENTTDELVSVGKG